MFVLMTKWKSTHREGGPEVPDAPCDDDVVVAAHQSGHHRRAVADATQGWVNLNGIQWLKINFYVQFT